MPDKKITELSPIVTIANGDVLPIVDISDNITKKIDIGQIKAQSPVQSVNSNIGIVVLTKTDIGLGQVDNTSDANKPISVATQNALNLKQDTLVSGTNIKTINSTTILGSGDISVAPASGINATAISSGIITNTEFDYLDGLTSSIQSQLNSKENSLGYTAENIANKSVSVTTDQASNTKYPSVKAVYDWAVGLFATITNLNLKQDTLISGTNIKTVNSTSLLGSGNVVIAGATWGSITGTLSTQTDLQTALDNKVDENAAIVSATKTKITYDAKGLVTVGADATTIDIADTTNKRYVTDANLVVIGNTSGTNSGDNAVNSLYSGLAASKQDTLSLTTTGTSGASTLIGATLNIPQYLSGATWGSITGTLSSQTDLQTALDTKVDENAAIVGATKTKITYDVKGLITAGADATTSDIADSTNKRYVTDAQLVIIGNTSGTNTGDNATNSQYSGLAASKQDTLISATNIKTINSTTLLGSGDLAVQPTLVSATNIKTINSISLLGSGDIVVGGLSAITTIGAVPNANGMTIVGSTLNLQPASVSFGGVVTTAAQSFAGRKTTTSDMTINTINAGLGLASIATNTTFGFEGLNANTTGNNNTGVGYQTLKLITTGYMNTAIGSKAISSGTTARWNTAIGFNSQLSLLSGSYNTSVGTYSSNNNTSGSANTAVGYNALYFNTSAGNTAVGNIAAMNSNNGYNTAVGSSSFTMNSSGTENAAVGWVAMGSGGTGSNNCAFGSNSLLNVTSSNNCGFGDYTLRSLTSGNFNTAIGSNSQISANTGAYNTSLGSYSLNACNTGGFNVAIGSNSLNACNSGNYNVAVGNQALSSTTSASNNTAIGYQSLLANASGTNNSALGFGTTATNLSGCVVLGKNATATANNQFVVGSTGTVAGAVTPAVNTSTQYWNVVINGVAQKILLA